MPSGSDFCNTNFISMYVYAYVHTYMYFFYHQKNLFLFSQFSPDVIKSGLEDRA